MTTRIRTKIAKTTLAAAAIAAVAAPGAAAGPTPGLASLSAHEGKLEMSNFARPFLGRRTALHPARTVVVAVLALGVAMGLVGLGEWITPASSPSTTAPVGKACGTIAPATMPLPGCRQLLTNMYLGTGMPCGTIMPRTVPTQECRRVLERVFLGPR